MCWCPPPTATEMSAAPTDHDLPPLNATPPGLYRHYKGGLYQVLALARHSETREPMVVYQALYGEYGHWVRPASMFTETVVVDGNTVPRFAAYSPQSGS